VFPDQTDCAHNVAGFRDDIEPVFRFEQHPDSDAHHRVIIGDNDADRPPALRGPVSQAGHAFLGAAGHSGHA